MSSSCGVVAEAAVAAARRRAQRARRAPRQTWNLQVGVFARFEAVRPNVICCSSLANPVVLYFLCAERAFVSHRIRRQRAAPARPAVREAAGPGHRRGELSRGNGTRFIDCAESAHVLRIGSQIGMLLPAHTTADGKVLLAELSAEQLAALYPRDL